VEPCYVEDHVNQVLGVSAATLEGHGAHDLERHEMAGVADTNTIDIVAQDAAGKFLVVMVETRPWGSDPNQPAQLREKINAYAGFILDGSLARRYPETGGCHVVIQLDCCQAPSDEIAAIIKIAEVQLLKSGIGFRVNHT